jgi:hypothetical protein
MAGSSSRLCRPRSEFCGGLLGGVGHDTALDTLQSEPYNSSSNIRGHLNGGRRRFVDKVGGVRSPVHSPFGLLRLIGGDCRLHNGVSYALVVALRLILWHSRHQTAFVPQVPRTAGETAQRALASVGIAAVGRMVLESSNTFVSLLTGIRLLGVRYSRARGGVRTASSWASLERQCSRDGP